MSDIGSTSAPARPYGVLGLCLSVVAAGALTGIFTAAGLALFALGDIILLGREHFGGLISSLMEAAGEGELSQFRLPLFAVGCLLYGAAILALLTVARWRGGHRWRDLLALRPFTADRLYWALVAAAIAYGLTAGWVIVKIYPEAKNWFQLPSGVLAAGVAFVLVVAFAPMAEELLFRGWLFTALRTTFSAPLTIAVTAALFAVAHWERTHLYALAVLPMGLLIGYVRERTGSARATMLLHAIYNCSGFVAKLLTLD